MVKISKTSEGGHGDHWAALQGFGSDLEAAVNGYLGEVLVNPANMRVPKLENGKRYSGAFGMQGRLAEW